MHGHGTVCAGVVGAVTNNNIGISGVCWYSKIMNVQISNETWVAYFTDTAKGIRYAADNGVDVISMSFGWVNKNDNIIKNACDYAYDKGVVLVAGAGNLGLNDEFNPAHFENVIAVAGTDNNDSRYEVIFENTTYASNYGPWIDVCSPAEYIFTTMPTYSVTMNERHGMSMNYEFQSGTSFASPIVAGIVAMILSKDSSLTPDEVRERIKNNVDPYHSIYNLGTGRVNAFKAVIGDNNKPEKQPAYNKKPTVYSHYLRFP